MRTEEIKLYKFEELSEESQDTAIESNRDINVDYDWWTFIYEDAESIGLKITGFDIDRGSYCNGDFILDVCEVSANIFRDHGEECETYKTAENFMEEFQPVFDNYMDENHPDYESSESEENMMDLEQEFKNSLCEDYRIILTKEYEYLTSYESIKEMLIANEYEFTANGEIY